jgi:hypothetical protein
VNATKMQPLRRRSILAAEDRRRSQRVFIRVPVTILTTENGQPVRTSGKTIEVNAQGAMVACSRSFDSSTNMEMLNERTGEKIALRILRAPRESAEGFLIPVEFIAPSTNFWQITFPPANWKAPES